MEMKFEFNYSKPTTLAIAKKVALALDNGEIFGLRMRKDIKIFDPKNLKSQYLVKEAGMMYISIEAMVVDIKFDMLIVREFVSFHDLPYSVQKQLNG